jgi:hypothetical protein
MMKQYRTWLAIEGLIFLFAALVHAGYILNGYAHFQASIAETVIAAILLLAMQLTFMIPAKSRRIALIAQGFALFGTLVGATMIAIGIGPQSMLDRFYHAGLLLMLITGLIWIWRSQWVNAN